MLNLIIKLLTGFAAGIYLMKTLIDIHTLLKMRKVAITETVNRGISREVRIKVIKSITVYQNVRSSFILNAFTTIILLITSFIL